MRRMFAALTIVLLAGGLSSGKAVAGEHPFGAELASRASDAPMQLMLTSGSSPATDALGDWLRPGAQRGRRSAEPQGRFGIESRPSGSRSLKQAAWRSLVLPGWGQNYLGAPSRGWFFIAGEALTWGTWSTFKTQEWLRKRSYTEMADVHAGVSGDHADDYWKIVGQYSNWIDYNEWLRFQGRREYGFGTTEYYDYISENEINAELGWTWNNEDRREGYAIKRKASLNAERRATYTLYALLVNRVVALVDTWRLSRSRGVIRGDLNDQAQSGFDLQSQPTETGLSWRLAWTREF